MNTITSATADQAPALLAGRRILVTGAAHGIGAAVMRRFAELGATGAAVDLSGAVDEFPKGWSASPADVTDENSLRTAIEQSVQRLGGLDGVVAAAGVVPGWQVPGELDLADLDRVLAVNVRGVAATIKLTSRHLGPGSTLAVVGSLNSWRGDPNIAGYAASKHAVLGLVRSAAMALGPRGVRVNCVGPGPVATGALLSRMADRSAATGDSVDDALSRAAELTALGRIATATDVANALAFLTSDLSAGITGQLLAVDGGIL